MKKLLLLSLFVVVSLLFVPAGRIGATPSATLVISEVQTRGTGGASQEFVELFNQSSAPVDVTGWQVKYAAAASTSFTTKATLSGMVAAHSFVLLSTSGYLPDAAVLSSGLADTGGHLILTNNTGGEVDRVGWGMAVSPEGLAASAAGLSDAKSLQRKFDPVSFFQDSDSNALDFVVDAPNPQSGSLVPEPEAEVPPVEPEEPPVVPCEGGVFSEIGANFVELYNPTSSSLLLENCQLLLDGTTYGFDSGSVLGSGQYLAVQFAVDLSGLGAATLVGSSGNTIVSYPALMLGQAWAVFDDAWQLTLQPTPGTANVLVRQTEEPTPLPEPQPEPEPQPQPEPTLPLPPAPQPESPVVRPPRPCLHRHKPPQYFRERPNRPAPTQFLPLLAKHKPKTQNPPSKTIRGHGR